MKTRSEKINLSGGQILAINKRAPEKLFSGDLEAAKREYYALSRVWHPDRNSDRQATAVFQHITELYRTARELIEMNKWNGAGILELAAERSKARKFEYFKRLSFELGEMYLGESEVAFAVERQFADLFENAKRQIARFHFAGDAMQKEMTRFLPAKPEFFVAPERLIMVLPKPADMVLLEDLLEYLGGAIDARHVGWIENRLYNLACYFEYAGVVHQDISPRTVFVSPKFHGAVLLGGWWYARLAGEKINALPKRTIKIAPPDILRRKKADARIDLELIRRTGREMLGAKTDAKLETDEKIPPAMARWFNGATSGSAVTDYELWNNVLEMDFGKPRFVRLEARPEAIYGV